MITYYSNKEDLKLDMGKFEKTDISNAQYCVIFGGDGTLLRFIHHIYNLYPDYNGVFVGINTGHVGFLTNDIDYDVFDISNFLYSNFKLNDKYIKEIYPIIINKYKYFAINEVLFASQNRGKLFEVNVNIYNEDLYFKGDGLIISTAIGSTAYNLSAGGSIIDSSLLKVMSLTPVAPFTLSSRPLIVGDIEIKVKPIRNCNIYIDGNEIYLNEDIYNIKLSIKPIKLLLFNNFIDAIQNKLGWNLNIKR